MARPVTCRRVGCSPGHRYFKPRGIPLFRLEESVVTVDEWEAIRLADWEGLYQEEAAERMNVSRQTFGRIVDTARRKIADALVNGKALRIEGGEIEMAAEKRSFRCTDCGHSWEVPYGGGRLTGCPKCNSVRFLRTDEGRGRGFGRGRGAPGRGWCGRRE